MNKARIMLTVNGQNIEFDAEPRKLLSDALREDCRLTGTHVGCEHGVCGACTVLVDGRPQRACLAFAIQMEGHEVTTIESVGSPTDLSILQQAMHASHGLQCGFCTPGIVMTFESFLREHPDPSEVEIREALSGNLCRCTGYQNIVRAIVDAAQRMKEASRLAGPPNPLPHAGEGVRTPLCAKSARQYFERALKP
ncbi:(2Fe-2S)-binding protein [Ottowia thiooxydans]|uniref:Carbon-monoxide dehydrogenase small subunit n=1 Tax=Ottowia thiooxydans TaxID=219182 RepID=A0ABV2Q9Q0_9BURK